MTTVLITGSNKGLGAETTRRLAAHLTTGRLILLEEAADGVHGCRNLQADDRLETWEELV